LTSAGAPTRWPMRGTNVSKAGKTSASAKPKSIRWGSAEAKPGRSKARASRCRCVAEPPAAYPRSHIEAECLAATNDDGSTFAPFHSNVTPSASLIRL
jgi:hypothetical protein